MKTAETQEIKTQLMQSDEHFRELCMRHHELDDRLHALATKHYLTSTEEFEEHTLKKLKLALKRGTEARDLLVTLEARPGPPGKKSDRPFGAFFGGPHWRRTRPSSPRCVRGLPSESGRGC